MKPIKSKNGWELCTLANGSLSCENWNLSPEHIEQVEAFLQPLFGRPMKREKIIVGYDNWSGVIIMQMPGIHTRSSDRLIKKIFVHLSNSEL